MPEKPHPASFRDPSGFVFERDGRFFRRIHESYRDHWSSFLQSGLYGELVDRSLIVPHEQIDADLISPETLDFVSHPYEWSFSQLKDAALTTLELQRLAISHGMWLKDASAYNIQRHRGKSLLIDSLSFESYREGAPWPAYRQFCEHFLAPLALMAMVDPRLSELQRANIDGIPLDLAARLLPGKSKWRPGLAIHIHAHARAQASGGGRIEAPRSTGVTKNALLGMVDNLKSTVEGLQYQPTGTTWANYYSKTNYSENAFAAKRTLVSEWLERIDLAGKSVWDLGANTGEFSVLASRKGKTTISWDIDPAAVERNYRSHREDPHLYPLKVDLTNPAPGTGWANRERQSFGERGPAGAILALALVHHLAIGNNVPLENVADFFADIAPFAIVEFVPKSDSQVQRLLSTRKDIYDRYTTEGFESAFLRRYEIVSRERVPESERVLFLLRRMGS